ncbi:MAG: DUF3857 domain-containing protein [Chitinophagaceae bacterium]|nr:MAG: DUF3857 domain-containing protein [Chitinophagaceae bacterium]
MNLRVLTILILCLAATTLHAQDKNKIKFGKISKADFEPSVYSLDSNASAIVLADIGSSEFKGNSKGWFSLEYRFLRRARIINRKGYDIAEVEIPIYAEDALEEELEQLKAVTYNLENGQVVETKLDPKEGVFKTRISKNLVIKKFTFPNIKEGSIIEYEYKLVSDFLFNLQPWNFQGDYPILWSEYKVAMPQFFYYISLFQGYQPFFLNEHKDKVVTFSINEDANQVQGKMQTFSSGLTEFRWAMKDVPALKEEKFTSTLGNHVSRIEFQLAEYREPIHPRNIMGTWPDAMKRLLELDDFGRQLNQPNGFMNDLISELDVASGSDLEKAKKIYTWVRDNMTNSNYNSIYLGKPLRQVLKSKTGSVTEINLLLVAMLRKVGVRADPVLLSTRTHGWAYANYPMLARFNYVIVQMNDNGQKVYLDASDPRLGFGKLGLQLYNGHARVVSENVDSLTIDTDQLLEAKTVSTFISNDGKGGISGFTEQRLGYFESYALRQRIAQAGTKGHIDEVSRAFGSDVTVHDLVIDSLGNYDLPATVKFQFDMPREQADLVYLNPMFGEGWKENPFKAATRNYPVEMPYMVDETYLLRLDIPEGYEVDELPKQVKIKLNEEDEGNFEYLISAADGAISLRSRLRLNRSYFYPEEYNSLREFFNLVVKKHSEQIVLKKKK